MTLAGGGHHSLAVQANGDLYAWGNNDHGQLGDGTTTDSSVPKLVGSGFASVAAGDTHSLAVRTGGDLFAWGNDACAQLGDGRDAFWSLPAPALVDRRPRSLAYAPAVATWSAGVAISPDVPAWTGFVMSFAVSPDLPPGLALDPATGAVAGTPATSSPTTSYEVTASGPLGSTTGLLTITVR